MPAILLWDTPTGPRLLMVDELPFEYRIPIYQPRLLLADEPPERMQANYREERYRITPDLDPETGARIYRFIG